MDLSLVNFNGTLSRPVENYDSLVWTERFNTVGDFQLTTGKVKYFMELLTEGKFLTHRETGTVMIVETHKIERKKNQPEKLTITGRSFESVLERRVALKSLSDITEWLVNVKLPSDAAYFIARYVTYYTNFGQGFDATIAPHMLYLKQPDDYLAGSGPVKAFSIPRGNLLTAVLQLVQTESPADATTSPATPAVVPHGIRSLRVRPAGDPGTIPFAPNKINAEFGWDTITLDIYTGTDRSGTVVFDGTRDMLDDGTYLFSKVGSATAAYVVGDEISAHMKDPTYVDIGEYANTNFNRRFILVDATTSGVADLGAIKQFGSAAISEAKVTSMFDGALNQDLSQYKFNQDYFLGDIVSLRGDYGLNAKARVTEYIRSDDQTGSKGYPTLSTI